VIGFETTRHRKTTYMVYCIPVEYITNKAERLRLAV
jgi:hypothetical protein